MTSDNLVHVPVLLQPVLELLQDHFSIEFPLKIWDGTVGLGGHAHALLQNFSQAKLFASDHDQEILQLAQKKSFERTQWKNANYSENPFGDQSPFNVIFLDLGVSSLHYDFFERGFSFRFEQDLDMRMDNRLAITARQWLNHANEKEIRDVLFRFGEEKKSFAIAKKICQLRRQNPITTTGQLKDICQSCYPPYYKARSHADRNPALRTFQAIRIFINKELESLTTALTFMPELLAINGLLVIISFHSLEDKLVKKKFQSLSFVPDPSPFAKQNYQAGNFRMLQNKAIMATAQEIEANQRARSARMRVLKRLK